MKFFLSKTFVLLVVFFLVQFPIHWTQSINTERMAFKNDAVMSVNKSYAGQQTIGGPILVFPYTRVYWENIHNANGEVVRKEQRSDKGQVSFLPTDLVFDNHMAVEERKVGIFPVPVFISNINISAKFNWSNSQDAAVVKPGDTIKWESAYIALPISDQHGIKSVETLTWNSEAIIYQPGSALPLYSGAGINATVIAEPSAGQGQVEIKLTLIGTERLYNLPTANQTRATTESNWPHPQFTGTQLPDERSVTEQGFTATWKSNALATNIQNLWQECFIGSNCKNLESEAVGVQLIDPTNFYTKVDRALKYGLLFLAITFIAFILFEVLCDLNIHPIQYTLLGVASGIFFLLLLSIAEHTGFALAYIIAAGACLSLLTVYVQAILKRWMRTLTFSSLLAGLYAALFTILQLEDAALLTGSILIFSLLTAAMMLTRHIDWHAWQTKFSKTSA